MRKTITILIVLVALLGGSLNTAAPVFATTDVPNLAAETGILIDAKTGTVLYNKEMDAQREPASMTKMITGILALERLPLDKVVTIDSETPFTGGSRIYLLEGEEITVEDLLYALFLDSANDAAVALAKEMGGTVEDFAVMMNQKARELGAKNTNFINPHGLHAEGHLSTCYDMAMIAKACMENPDFRKFVTTYKYTIQPTNKQEEPRYLYNTNRLLYDTKTKVSANGVIRTAKYDGVTGIKTGYTGQAGGCLAASAERNGTELIAVTMKSTDTGRFGDCIALLDWGFENYHTVQTITKGTEMGTLKVNKGSEKTVALVTEADGYATLPVGTEAEALTKVTKVADGIDAPVKAGQIVGTADFFQGDLLMNSVNIVAKGDIQQGGALAVFGVADKTASKIYLGLGIFAALLAAAAGGLYCIRLKNLKRRQKRRAERAMRLAMEREMEKLYYNKDKFMNR